MKNTLSQARPVAWLMRFVSVFRYSGVAIDIVWLSSAGLTIVMALVTLIAGVLPAAIAWVGQLIVDAVVTAIDSEGAARDAATDDLLRYILFELGLVVLMTGAQKANSVCQSV
ncbi:MAG: ABC transporter ATP-binding protein, partial [Pseudohongiella sp.]